MFEKFSAYAIFVVAIGGFIWLSSCAIGEYAPRAIEGMAKSYDQFRKTQNERGCKDVIIQKTYSEKIKCDHPEHTLVMVGPQVECRCK